MPSRSETALFPIGIDRKHIRHFFNQPFGRCGGRGSEDYSKARVAKRLDGPIQPTPIEFVRLGFNPTPREFADAHAGKAQFGHAARVGAPHRLRPMLRIIANPKSHHVPSLPAHRAIAVDLQPGIGQVFVRERA